MRYLVTYCLFMFCSINLVQAQIDCETNLAIKKFINQINDSTMQSKKICFYTKFLSNDIPKCFPSKVGKYTCKYFSSDIDIDKYCIKNKLDFFYTIKATKKNNGDTIEFFFGRISVEVGHDGSTCEIFAECRGYSDLIIPEIRIINTSSGDKIIQSSISEINNKIIYREDKFFQFDTIIKDSSF